MSKKNLSQRNPDSCLHRLISRIAGFFYRIFLSYAIGAEGLGLYQLVLPLQGLMAALSYTGIQAALSRLIASRLALQEKKEARFSLVTGTLMAVFFSAAAGFLLFQHAYFFASTILKTPQTASLLRITAVSIPLCAIHSCIDSYYYARKKPLFRQPCSFRSRLSGSALPISCI